MESSDSRHGVTADDGPLRFLDFSFPTRCLQSPRGVRRRCASVKAPTITGFTISGRLATPTLCNGAESSSLALRLAGSPRRASAWGLLLSPPHWLHDGHSVVMVITFHITKEVRLGLTHRKATECIIRPCPDCEASHAAVAVRLKEWTLKIVAEPSTASTRE